MWYVGLILIHSINYKAKVTALGIFVLYDNVLSISLSPAYNVIFTLLKILSTIIIPLQGYMLGHDCR